MEKKTIKYFHHNKHVSVIDEMKGKHADYCLCWNNCRYFTPKDREMNCPIANVLFSIDCAMGVTTPVWECEKYELFEPDGQPSK